MDAIKVRVTLKDTFSGCTDTIIKTLKEGLVKKLEDGKGKQIRQFDKQAQIAFFWEVQSVERI